MDRQAEIAAIECNYKEIHRQLKEQFIHGLNDTDISAEIIRQLTKIHEDTEVTDGKVVSWAKRVDAQRAQFIINIH